VASDQLDADTFFAEIEGCARIDFKIVPIFADRYMAWIIILLLCVLIIIDHAKPVTIALVAILFVLVYYFYIGRGRSGFTEANSEGFTDIMANTGREWVSRYKPKDTVYMPDSGIVCDATPVEDPGERHIPRVPVPPELDNSDSIEHIYDNPHDRQDEWIDLLQYQQKLFKRGLDHNIRNNVDVYSTWWRDDLEECENRYWFEHPEISDAANYLTDSINQPERLDTWIETGYVHV